MKKFALALALIFCGSIVHAQTEKPLLLRQPTLSEKQIAFVYGDDIWTVGREGGEAVRLTSGTGAKSNPRFSPDGSLIAFSAKYAGRTNVYVVPATGGNPRRVTFHAGPDIVAGWTNDGKSILFASQRETMHHSVSRLYTVSVDGGFATPLPLPRAFEGSFSADGTHLAYRPVPLPWGTWSHYRGGTSAAVWIANLADSRLERVPREDCSTSIRCGWAMRFTFSPTATVRRLFSRTT